MDREKDLVLLKKSNGNEFVDKTNDIIHLVPQNGRYIVTFNEEKSYSYSFDNVIHLKDPAKMDLANTIIYINNRNRNDIDKIFDFGSYVRIFFKSGKDKTYEKKTVTFVDSCLKDTTMQKRFEYFKTISALNRLNDEEKDDKTYDDKPSTFLKSQYDKITKIHSESILSLYLGNGSIIKKDWGKQYVFPFGFNISQKEAIKSALENNVSIIEGPPGTGKTQTILSIIANVVMAKKTIAVVSNNNSAVENVQEKLGKNGLDFISAFLGNKKNRENFFINQSGKYPDFQTWTLEKSEIIKLQNKVSEIHDQLDILLKKQNEMASLKQDLSALLVERKYFDEFYIENGSPEFGKMFIFKLSPKKLLAFIAELEVGFTQDRLNSLFAKIKLFLQYGFYKLQLLKDNMNLVVIFLQNLYYDIKISQLETSISDLESFLKGSNFDSLVRESSEISMNLFKANLANRYSKNSGRTIFTGNEYKVKFDRFIQEYPVLLSTTHSLRNCIEENYLFDFVIIDEASQVDIVTGALALSCAKNAIIVGDTKQLPQIVTKEIEDQCLEIHVNSGLPKCYDYLSYSILSSFVDLFREKIPRTLLKEHYRCHPKIIGFCNQKYYDNQLIILTKENSEDEVFKIYKTVPGNHERRLKGENKGVYNERQIDVIFKEILTKEVLGNKSQIGIVSPYRLQANKIKERLSPILKIDADTVHKYQGREKDIMIMTTVVNKVNEFIDDPNLINVAVSRAISKFYIVTSPKSFTQHGTNIGDLIRYIKYHTRDEDIVNSDIVSVFDLLYSEYSEELKEIAKKVKNVSEYQSENLMNFVIEKVLKDPEFSCFKHALHVPLKLIIKDTEQLTVEERKYANNIWTNVDFLIYNKLDKTPVLAIEVDGFAFHEKNPKRLAKDELKDNILKKYKIPILRVKTNESGEDAKLIEKLNRIKSDELITEESISYF